MEVISQRISKRLSQRISQQLEKGTRGELVAESPDVEVKTVKDDAPVTKKVHDTPKIQWAARLQTGYEGNLTPGQEEALAKFKEIMLSGEYKNDVLNHRDGVDRVCLRFLRAECSKSRVFNVEKSVKRLTATLEWRRQNKIDELLENPPPKFEEFLKVNGETSIIDNEGRVLTFTRAAIMAATLDPKVFTVEEWWMLSACLMERRMAELRKQSALRGYEISATVLVFDMRGGLPFSARRLVSHVLKINEMSAAHYPELVDVIYVPMIPRIFNALYGLVAPFLDSVTKEKIRLFSSSASEQKRFIRELRQIVDMDVLPKEFGGDSDIDVIMPLHAIEKGYTKPKPFPSDV